MIRTQIVGRKLYITDALENKIMEKVYHLDETLIHNKEDSLLFVTLFIEKENHICKVRFSNSNHTIIINKESDDMYYSIGLAFESLERNIRKEKEKKIDLSRIPKDKNLESDEIEDLDEDYEV